LLCVENETGKLAVYDLETMEMRDEFTFSSPISMLRFSQDGRRLFVLTASQTAYVLDVSAIAKQQLARNTFHQFWVRIEGVILERIGLFVLFNKLGNFSEDVLNRLHHLQ
jgi:hypothetical protein